MHNRHSYICRRVKIPQKRKLDKPAHTMKKERILRNVKKCKDKIDKK